MASTGDRIMRLRQKMADDDIDTLLVLAEENRRYLAGFTGEDTQYDESAGALLITRDAKILATDSRYETQARNECEGFDVVVYTRGLTKELPALLRQLGARRTGFESRRISYEEYARIREELEKDGLTTELVPTAEMVEGLRLVKDEDEISAIRKAVFLAEEAFRDFLENALPPDITEKAAAWEMEKRMRERGAQSLSFPMIAAFGTNSALPHAIPTERRHAGCEPLLFDWGARLDGYCSDMTRTIFLESPHEELAKIFATAYEAQQMAIDAVRPGKTTREIDAVAREHIEAAGYKGYFGHGLGHGVGLAVHEAPSLSPVAEKEKTLSENMVFTVEPGIYLPEKGGVRLENIVVVRAHGPEILNTLPVRMDRFTG